MHSLLLLLQASSCMAMVIRIGMEDSLGGGFGDNPQEMVITSKENHVQTIIDDKEVFMIPLWVFHAAFKSPWEDRNCPIEQMFVEKYMEVDIFEDHKDFDTRLFHHRFEPSRIARDGKS